MIDFRYHVVSIVAVFLALALGLFIGSTTLRGPVATDLNSRVVSVTHTNNQLRGELTDARNQLSRSASFDNALLPYAVANRLAGESVVVISAPGADSGIRTDLVRALGAAGATISGDVRLQDALVDPQQDAFLGTLADRVALPHRPLAGSGAERALALLTDVLVTKPQAPTVSARAATRVLAAFTAGKLISISGDTTRPASLAFVIAAPATTSSDASASPQPEQLLATLTRDLDRTAAGIVAVGPSSAADAGGLLDVIRSDKALRTSVSTVDGLELPSGVIAAVMAAAEQVDGRAGSYGSAAGADAPLPTPSPS